MIRPLADIRRTGAAWLNENELAWLCDRIERLEAHNATLRAQRAARAVPLPPWAEPSSTRLVEALDAMCGITRGNGKR
jgi:hypothetical protein